ncbi:hypothetical protein [Paenibacillus sp. Y412MC10]|uniref:hypothetical protein n=1 Tax=Geobacillus sp. (strain Y412MC10) TaxID=481743 RepID=UPI001C930E3C|nr:hypothetical protein [Paenibacillus sp. Y412MC10]
MRAGAPWRNFWWIALRSHPAGPLRVRLMLPTAVAREFLGMDDEEEIRSQRRPLRFSSMNPAAPLDSGKG